MYETIVKTLLHDIADERVNKHKAFTLFGYNPSVSTTAEDIWEYGGAYTYPTIAQQMRAVSTSANDTVNGTGIRKIKIHYTDAQFNAKTEIVTLSGLTPVNTVATDLYRINYVIAEEVGSLNGAAGAITLTNMTGNVIYGHLGINRTIDRHLSYTVPKGCKLHLLNFMMSVSASTNGRSARVIFEANYNPIEHRVMSFPIPQFTSVIQDQLVDIPLELPLMFPEGTTFDAYAEATGGDVAVAVTIRGYLEEIIPTF